MHLHSHQQRVEDEKNELDTKIGALGKFLGGSIFESLDAGEQDRLKRQYQHMAHYSDVLGERISNF